MSISKSTLARTGLMFGAALCGLPWLSAWGEDVPVGVTPISDAYPIPTPMAIWQLIPPDEGELRLDEQRLDFDYEGTLAVADALAVQVDPALAAQRERRRIAEGSAAIVTNMDELVVDRDAAIQLGKALFWDMRVGSDGQTACATCHYAAGADSRQSETGGMRRGSMGVAKRILTSAPTTTADLERSTAWTTSGWEASCRREWGNAWASHCVTTPTVPSHLAPQDRPILEQCEKGGGAQARMDTCKNSSTVIGASAMDRLFHDGSARGTFNGYDILGDDAEIDPIGTWRVVNRRLERVSVRLPNSALASQAMGPPLNVGEMSWEGRRFYHIAKKLLDTRPLRAQEVSVDDSVLGSLYGGYAPNQQVYGAMTYRDLIRAAFAPAYWDDSRGEVRPRSVKNPVDGKDLKLKVTEANFSLFFGVAIQMYEATLVPGDTPFDRYYSALRDGVAYTGTDFGEAEKEGFRAFVNHGCADCHALPEFTIAARSHIHGPSLEHEEPLSYFENTGYNAWLDWYLSGSPWVNQVTEFLNVPPFLGEEKAEPITPRKIVTYDAGFYNIGMAPERAAPGIGADLSPYATAAEKAKPRSQALARNGGDFQLFGTAGVSTDSPLDLHATWVLGATRTPSLRNVELTPPYFSDVEFGAESLDGAVAVYNAPPFRDINAHLHPEMREMFVGGDDIAAIAVFLRSLTDDRVRRREAPFDVPSLVVPVRRATRSDGSSETSSLTCLPFSPAIPGDDGGCVSRVRNEYLNLRVEVED
jgi:cytochrome c peroxidase